MINWCTLHRSMLCSMMITAPSRCRWLLRVRSGHGNYVGFISNSRCVLHLSSTHPTQSMAQWFSSGTTHANLFIYFQILPIFLCHIYRIPGNFRVVQGPPWPPPSYATCRSPVSAKFDAYLPLVETIRLLSLKESWADPKKKRELN